MSQTSSHVAPYMLASATLVLAACSGRQDAASESAAIGPPAQSAGPGSLFGGARTSTLSDGPDVCFRAVAKHLGSNTKIAELTSFFSAGSDIDSTDTEPKGQMKTCSVNYQNPTDARKLLTTSMDVASGIFSQPMPVEIMVMGDESKFRLEDNLIRLSQVNAAALTATMKSQEPKLGVTYSHYAWSGVRLEGPSPFSSTPTLRLDVEGRLAVNDIKKNGYASVTTDGKTIKTNDLTS